MAAGILSPQIDWLSNFWLQTQDRMLKSAENFMAGFFGLEWYGFLPAAALLVVAPLT